MSQRIVIFCDAHQARDEDVPGKSYDVALRPVAGMFEFVTVDLCDSCAKPLLDVFAEASELGRVFEGDVPGGVSTKRQRRPPKTTSCPVCGHAFAHRGSLRQHTRTVHGKSINELEDSTMDVFTCPHCEGKYERPQGLSAHIRSAHPAEYAKARKAKAGK